MKTGRNADTKPYLPFYVDDWFASARVRVMSTAQRGAYLELLFLQWREGSVPTSPMHLERMFPDVKGNELAEIVEAFPGGKNQRLERVRDAASEQQKARTESAKKANAVRWESVRSPSGSHAEAEAEAEADGKAKAKAEASKRKRAPRAAAPPLDLDSLVAGSVLDTAQAKAAISQWLSYKAQKGQGYKPIGIQALISRLAAWGPVRAEAAIRHSIAQNYSGIFESGPNGNGPGGGKPEPKGFQGIRDYMATHHNGGAS